MAVEFSAELRRRAAVYAALADPARLANVDVVAGMGCGDTCPVLPGHRYEEWVLDDPAGRSLGDVRPIRDEIERRVRLLRTELGIPARTKQPRRW